MGVSNYTPTGISHATSVDFSKRSVNQPVHIVQYDRSLPILAVSLYNNGQLYRLSESMEVSIRLGKPDRTFVYNKALGCDSTRTIVYFEITQQMSLFDGEYYPVIEIMDGDKIANSSTIYLVVDRNPVQHDYIESTIEYKELVDYRDEAVKAGNEAKEAAKIAKDSVQTVVDKTKEAVEASETAVNAANSASESAESILGVEENVTRVGNMVSEKESIITSAAETASTSATNAKASEDKAKKSEEAAKQSETNAKESADSAKVSETNAKESETNAKASADSAKVSETNAKESETNAKASADSIRESEINAKASADRAKVSETNAESYAHGGTGTREGEDTDNARYYMEQAKAVSDVDIATAEKAGIVKPDGETITVDKDGTLHGANIYELPVATTEILGGVKPDGTTITVDEDGTLHGSSSVNEMTGATADADGTSGTVPAPMAGQENHVLKGNGAWEALAYDSELSAESENAPQTKVVDAKTKEIEENLSQLSNPNLLINPDFKINQRDRYGSGISHEYAMDRWFTPHGLTDCTYDNSLQALHVHATVNEGLEQRLEDCSNLLGKKVTLSICYKSTGRFNLTGIQTFSDSTISWICVSECEPTDSFVIKSVTGYVKSEAVNARFGFSLGNFDVWVKWIKLELGSVATPFVPPDPASELVKCQRYFQKHGCDLIPMTTRDGTISFRGSLYTQMRSIPSLFVNRSDLILLQVADNTAHTVNISIKSSILSKDGVGLIWCASDFAFTVGSDVHWNCNYDNTFYFDAEIY